MRRLMLVLLAVIFSISGRAFAGSALYLNDSGPNCTSGIIRAACLDAGYTDATYQEVTTLPGDLSGYDLIILYVGPTADPYWGVQLGTFLNNGGRVLSLGASCFYLVADWTGADYGNGGGQARVVFDAPSFGLHEGDIVDSSNNASDPSYRCAAAAWYNLWPGAVELARWEPNPNGADCGQSTYAFGYPYGAGIHVAWGDVWQYSAIRGIIQFLAP